MRRTEEDRNTGVISALWMVLGATNPRPTAGKDRDQCRRMVESVERRKSTLHDRDVDMLNLALYMGGYTELVIIQGSNTPKQREAALQIMSAGLASFVSVPVAKALYLGVEHVGLHPVGEETGDEISDWYVWLFGFTPNRGISSIFLTVPDHGRIEVMLDGDGKTSSHLAILTSDFDQAIADLGRKGVKLDEHTLVERPDTKVIYLQDTDPSGRKVHLLWRP